MYTEKNALVAADMLNSKVLPYFDEEQMRVLRILTDRGSEYCGKTERHPFQLFLHLNDTKHSRTKAYHPQTNGSTEKLNQTTQEEFYKVAFRKALYSSLDQIQADLDSFMRRYNEERTNPGKSCRGRAPKEAFDAGFELYKKYVIDQTEVKAGKQVQ